MEGAQTSEVGAAAAQLDVAADDLNDIDAAEQVLDERGRDHACSLDRAVSQVEDPNSCDSGLRCFVRPPVERRRGYGIHSPTDRPRLPAWLSQSRGPGLQCSRVRSATGPALEIRPPL